MPLAIKNQGLKRTFKVKSKAGTARGLSEVFTVTCISCISTNTCKSVVIKYLVKTMKYTGTLNFLQKFTPLSLVMLYVAVYVKIR